MKKNKIGQILLRIVLVLLLAGGIGFGVYVSNYYHAGETAQQILSSGEVIKEKNWLELPAKESDTGLIFYPGGKVEYTAYLPLLKAWQEEGINCYLVKMPFNLAFFGWDRADDVIQAHPEISTWYMAGHSLGGAFASQYAGKHQEQIKGLILLGAYLYGDYPQEQSITIYGSEDQVLNRSKITYQNHVYCIEGGNHGQFGDYGFQKGDGEARISPEEQILETVDLVKKVFSNAL